MPLIIGPVRVGIKSGAKFNLGRVFLVSNKNNLHIEGEVNSFNQGNKNSQYSFANYPDVKFRKVRTHIIDKKNI